MGELYNPFPKLPKNIRQIGERDDVVKLYVEDYVNIYLKHLYPTGGQELRVGLLLGSTEQHDGMPYIFVDGAMEMEEATITGEKVTFTETAWKKAYQSIEDTFPKRTIQGWFLCGAPGCTLSPLNYWKQHGQYFSGKNQLMYLNSGIEGDESVYITSDDGFYRIRGYSVFFERNQMMQDYMILRKDVRRVESGANDRVIRDFRQRMEGRKMEAVTRRGTIRTLGTLCGVLSVAVLAGGVVMFNNYQKMQEMETVLVSVLPSGVKNWKGLENKAPEDDIVVEEIHGSVSPADSGNDQTQPDAAAGGQAVNTLPIGETAGQAGGSSQAGGNAPTAGQPGASDQPGTAGVETGAADKSGTAAGQSGAEEGRTGTSESQSASAGQSGNGAGAAESSQTASVLSEPEEAPGISANILGSGGNSTAEKDYPVTNMKPGGSYTIGEGETLYGICFKLYDDLTYLNDICALNQISDVDKITSGQTLVLPDLAGIQ